MKWSGGLGVFVLHVASADAGQQSNLKDPRFFKDTLMIRCHLL